MFSLVLAIGGAGCRCAGSFEARRLHQQLGIGRSPDWEGLRGISCGSMYILADI